MSAPASKVDGMSAGAVDVLAVRAKAEAAMWSLFDKADSIEDASTRCAVSGLIMSAIDNANDTVDVEGESDDWGYMARESLRSLLDCGGERVTPAVQAWFIAESRAAAQKGSA